MNSRERVLATLEHREPDRVPIDLGGSGESLIAEKAHKELKKYLGLVGGEVKISPLWHVVEPDERILRMFDVDTRGVQWGFPYFDPLRIEEKEDGYYCSDQFGIKYRMPKVKGYYFDMISHPLEHADLKDLEAYDLPDPHDQTWQGVWEDLERKAKHLYEDTDYALIAGSTCGVLELACWLRGMTKFLMDLIVSKRFAEKLMNKVVEFHIAFWDEMLSRVGDYVQIAKVGEDLGTQIGPIVGLDMFRELIKPRNKKIWRFIKKKTGIYLLLHSCGSVCKFIPDFIEMGVDALNPVQVSAKDMDTRRLKEEFGGELTFWGGCDTQRVLPFGTPEDVVSEVKRRIKDLAPRGGYVLSSVHHVQADVPPENIVAMLKAVREYGKYPIKI